MLVHSLITLAHNIGLRVIVEGVENSEQLALIGKLGGNEIQGYLLGRPVADPSSTILSASENTGSQAQLQEGPGAQVPKEQSNGAAASSI
jgi:EAL domain-containing protein (putative c-di-GMP-specific phosphodiesterase class I)